MPRRRRPQPDGLPFAFEPIEGWSSSAYSLAIMRLRDYLWRSVCNDTYSTGLGEYLCSANSLRAGHIYTPIEAERIPSGNLVVIWRMYRVPTYGSLSVLATSIRRIATDLVGILRQSTVVCGVSYHPEVIVLPVRNTTVGSCESEQLSNSLALGFRVSVSHLPAVWDRLSLCVPADYGFFYEYGQANAILQGRSLDRARLFASYIDFVASRANPLQQNENVDFGNGAYATQEFVDYVSGGEEQPWISRQAWDILTNGAPRPAPRQAMPAPVDTEPTTFYNRPTFGVSQIDTIREVRAAIRRRESA